jgi:hypothetical protein
MADNLPRSDSACATRRGGRCAPRTVNRSIGKIKQCNMEEDDIDTTENPEPVEIVPNLFLGSWRSSRMLDRLLELKVGLIVNCAAELENNYPEAFEYVHLELRDVPTATMSTMYQYFASKEMSSSHFIELTNFTFRGRDFGFSFPAKIYFLVIWESNMVLK